MSEQRPNPDDLLMRIHQEEQRANAGRLKLFFGASPGVGKTFAMLSEARDRQAAGTDVVCGVVETHGRAETEALLHGMEILPRRAVAYRGVTLQEFDLDAALARRPGLLLVDELAHTNAPESRHAKRWQDVGELLDAGIDVYTTVNVQHLESLNDVVAQITGVIVRETVPDSIFERANEIELVDLPPEELLQRLREGKVYVPERAATAARNFFRHGNLIALRDLALRTTAERVDAQMQRYRRDKAISAVWPTRERVLVCVGLNPLSSRLVRAGRRLASALGAPWVVLYIETPAELRKPEVERDLVSQSLRLAEQLGAETLSLAGANAAEEILAFARQRNMTKIIVGKPLQPRWRELVFGSLVDTLIRGSGEIDVYVISGDAAEPPSPLVLPEPTSPWQGYAWALAVVALISVFGGLIQAVYADFAEANLIMAYLLGVIGVARWLGRGPSILASLLSVLVFDFFFVPPMFTFAVSDAQYVLTFVVMLAAALAVSTLTYRLRQQAESARQRERRTAALYALSRQLASLQTNEQLLQAAVVHSSETFESQVVVLLPNGMQRRLQPWGEITGWWAGQADARQVFAPDDKELGIAQWAFDHRQHAGLGTNTLPSGAALYTPLHGVRGPVGVLGVRPFQRRVFTPDQLHLLETFANQIALAMERAQLRKESEQAQLDIEAERLRNSLLASVSHDLRTPLATITGAASSLLEGDLSAETGHELLVSIFDESARMNRLIGNLLEMTRLESGTAQVRKEWQPVDEVIGSAVARTERSLAGRPLALDLPNELLLAPLDFVLIEQALINLLENAARYTPPGTPIDVRAFSRGGEVVIEVDDRGPGIAPGQEQRVFEKFYRGSEQPAGGAGLGLAIVAGIMRAHRGRAVAAARPGGGAVFQLLIPLEGAPPKV